MKESSVSPERWETMTPPAVAHGHIRGIDCLGYGADLVHLQKQSIAGSALQCLLDALGVRHEKVIAHIEKIIASEPWGDIKIRIDSQNKSGGAAGGLEDKSDNNGSGPDRLN